MNYIEAAGEQNNFHLKTPFTFTSNSFLHIFSLILEVQSCNEKIKTLKKLLHRSQRRGANNWHPDIYLMKMMTQF